MNKIPKIILIIIIVFIVVWLASLAKCEIFSFLHGNEFYGLDETSINMLTKSENVKVLKYADKYAEVYYYNKSGACVLKFTKNNGEWQMLTCNSIWSATGSASDVIWPYWWHFIYGGF